jgi:hypothetical protein
MLGLGWAFNSSIKIISIALATLAIAVHHHRRPIAVRTPLRRGQRTPRHLAYQPAQPGGLPPPPRTHTHTRPGNYPAQPSGVSVSTRDTSPFEKSDTDIGGDGWSFEHQQLEYRCNYGLLTSLGSSEVAKFSPWEMELVGVGETDGVRQAAGCCGNCLGLTSSRCGGCQCCEGKIFFGTYCNVM